MVSQYIFFDSKKKQFLALRKPDQIFAPRDKSHYLVHGKSAGNNEADVDAVVWNRSNPLDATPIFISFFCMNQSASAISSNPF